METRRFEPNRPVSRLPPRDERFLHLSDLRFILAAPIVLATVPGLADEVVVVPMPEDPDRSLVVARMAEPLGWAEASNLIDAVGGTWFVPTTPAERKLVGSAASDLGPWECVGPWIGAIRPATVDSIDEGWTTIDGTALAAAAWSSDSPAGASRLRWVAALDGRTPDLQEWINLLPGADVGPASFGFVATIPNTLPDCDGDGVPDAIEEAWFDSLSCDDTCPADVDGNDEVDAGDLGLLLSWFGRTCPPGIRCAGDLDRDGRVDGADLGLLFIAWGRCP